MDAPNTPQPIDGKDKFTGKRLVLLSSESSFNQASEEAKNSSLRLANSLDYQSDTNNYKKAFQDADGIVFERFGVAVINENHEDQIKNLTASASSRQTFLYTEPERYLYALTPAQMTLWQRICAIFFPPKRNPGAPIQTPEPPLQKPPSYRDDATAYWGLHATKVLESSFTGKGINLAILDTGFNTEHPDFQGRSITTASFVESEPPNDLNGHGTHCAGIAAGDTNRENNIRYGVAKDANLYIGKVLSNEGTGSDSGILAGLEWAIQNNCKIVSMSLGGSVQKGESYSRIYNDLANKLMAQGMIIIAAAGNDSRRNSGIIRPVSHPANCPAIMAVGALDQEMAIADFSCAGINTDGGEINVAAPGVAVYSAYRAPQLHQMLSGTSMATPFVSGIAALLWEEFPEESPEGIWSKIQQYALEVGLPSSDVGSGLARAVS